MKKDKEQLTANKKNSWFSSQDTKRLILALFICFAISALIAKSLSTFVINVIVLCFMIKFIQIGFGKSNEKGLFALEECTNDLKQITVTLNELSKKNIEDPLNELRNHFKFQNDTLKEAFQSFFAERDAAYIGTETYYQCDVAEYVHEDLLDDIGRSSISEFVSNSLTGLGIFGTFIGLVIGLHSFDASSAESLTASISPLIEGIKVAFLTSIYGVVLSLIYGTTYRNRMNEAETALREFQTVYYKIMGQHPENEAIAKLLRYQESQTDSMNQFAEDISVAVADALEAKLVPTLNNVPEQIGVAINQAIQPTMQQMGKQFELVADKLSQAQTSGVENIVDKFVEQMNQSMGGQFENLSETIKSICEWQKVTMKEMGQAVEMISQNVKKTTQAREALETMIEKLESYVNTLDQIQTKNMSYFETILSTLQVTSDGLEDLANEMEEMTECTKEIVDSVSKTAYSIQNQEANIGRMVDNQLDCLREGSQIIKKQADEMETMCSNVTMDFNEASSRMIQTSDQLLKDMDTAMERTYAQFDSQLAKAMEHFNGTLNDLRETMENTPKVIDGSVQKMQHMTQTYLAQVQKAQNDYNETVQNTIKQLVENMSQMKGYVEQIEQSLKKIYE